MTEVRLAPEALDELSEAASWYEKRSEGLGAELLDEVEGDIAHRPERIGMIGPEHAAADREDLSIQRLGLSMEALPTQVTVKSRIVVRASVIGPKQYAAWQQFCADVDQALTPRLVVASQ